MKTTDLNNLKLELSLSAKNGIDFIISASIIWLLISYIWTLPYSSYDKSVFTFIIGSFMIPLTLLFSKILKTSWKVKDNPLQPLGLWLNFAQLFYFPFLIFVLIKQPDYFVMSYVIITGAHFFPYAWFYNERAYAVIAGIIVLGALFFGLYTPVESLYIIPIFMAVSLMVLAVVLYLTHKIKLNSHEA
ncbi:DUF7010 family protein [Urechidicola croceus]|uniref:Uncharacterized protein n=1 Tax=Urechidicola croceus TaxID=1850246 RepID=A0A1D8P8V3_9FLAO|nr:hypothetical protein [Urechidicola croceus]AOW20998.1 hypothetical protein LPB138_10050 [Urechidicola croceus]